MFRSLTRHVSSSTRSNLNRSRPKSSPNTITPTQSAHVQPTRPYTFTTSLTPLSSSATTATTPRHPSTRRFGTTISSPLHPTRQPTTTTPTTPHPTTTRSRIGLGTGATLPAAFGFGANWNPFSNNEEEKAPTRPVPELPPETEARLKAGRLSQMENMFSAQTGPRDGETMEQYKKRVDPENIARSTEDLALLERLQYVQGSPMGDKQLVGKELDSMLADISLAPGLPSPAQFDATLSAIKQTFGSLTKEQFAKLQREVQLPKVRGLEKTYAELLTWEGIEPNSPLYDYQIDIDNVHLLPTKVILTGDKLSDLASTQEYCLRNAILIAKMMKGMENQLTKHGIWTQIKPAKPYLERFTALFPGFTSQNTPEFSHAQLFLEPPETLMLNGVLENWLEVAGNELVKLNAVHNNANMSMSLPNDEVYCQQQDLYYDALLEHVALTNSLRSEVERMTGILFNVQLLQNSYKSPHWCDAYFNTAPHYEIIGNFLDRYPDRSNPGDNSTVLNLALAKAQLMWPVQNWTSLFTYPHYGDKNPSNLFQIHLALGVDDRLKGYRGIYQSQNKKRLQDVEDLIAQEAKLTQLQQSANENVAKAEINKEPGSEEPESDLAWKKTKKLIDDQLKQLRRELNELQRPRNWPLLSVVTDEPKPELLQPIDEVIGTKVLDLTVFESDLKPHLRPFVYSAHFLSKFGEEPLTMTEPKQLQRRPLYVNTHDPRWVKFHREMMEKKIDALKTPLVESSDYLAFGTIADTGKALPAFAWGGKDGSEAREISLQMKKTADELKESRLRMIRLKEIEDQQLAELKSRSPGTNKWGGKRKSMASEASAKLFKLKYDQAHADDLDYNPYEKDPDSAFGIDYSAYNDLVSDDDDVDDLDPRFDERNRMGGRDRGKKNRGNGQQEKKASGGVSKDYNDQDDFSDIYNPNDVEIITDSPLHRLQQYTFGAGKGKEPKGQSQGKSQQKQPNQDQNQQDQKSSISPLLQPYDHEAESQRWKKLTNDERIAEGLKIEAAYEASLANYAKTYQKTHNPLIVDDDKNNPLPPIAYLTKALPHEASWDVPPTQQYRKRAEMNTFLRHVEQKEGKTFHRDASGAYSPPTLSRQQQGDRLLANNQGGETWFDISDNWRNARKKLDEEKDRLKQQRERRDAAAARRGNNQGNGGDEDGDQDDGGNEWDGDNRRSRPRDDGDGNDDGSSSHDRRRNHYDDNDRPNNKNTRRNNNNNNTRNRQDDDDYDDYGQGNNKNNRNSNRYNDDDIRNNNRSNYDNRNGNDYDDNRNDNRSSNNRSNSDNRLNNNPRRNNNNSNDGDDYNRNDRRGGNNNSRNNNSNTNDNNFDRRRDGDRFSNRNDDYGRNDRRSIKNNNSHHDDDYDNDRFNRRNNNDNNKNHNNRPNRGGQNETTPQSRFQRSSDGRPLFSRRDPPRIFDPSDLNDDPTTWDIDKMTAANFDQKWLQ